MANVARNIKNGISLAVNMKKILARIYISLWCSIAFGGSTAFGVFAGICIYLESGHVWPAISMFLLISILLFLPIAFICGFALCDEQVWYDAEW